MFFFQLVILTAIGALGIHWAMKGACELGRDDFAYDFEDIFTWINMGIYEVVASAGIFCGIFLINSLLDQIMDIPIVLTMANNHLIYDGIFASIVAQLLLWAMIFEGIRIRTGTTYLNFERSQLIRPSFFQLYRLW